MILLELFDRHGEHQKTRILATSALGGVLGSGVVALASYASSSDQSLGSLELGLTFVVALVVMLVCNRWSARVLVEVFEEVQRSLRDDLAARLREAPLRTIETLGEAHGRVTGDLTFISAILIQLVGLVRNLAFLLCVTLVILTVSMSALLIWLLTCAAMTAYLMPRLERLDQLRKRQSQRGGAVHGALEELLAGLKQLKLDPARREQVSAKVHRQHASYYTGHAKVTLAGNLTFLVAYAIYACVGIWLAVFIPEDTPLLGLDAGESYEMSILLALSLGPLSATLQTLPIAVEAEAAAASVVEVLDRLAAVEPEPAGADGRGFARIELRELEFVYGEQSDGEAPGFAVGPLDLDLRRGELVLITGGNGSGKTTLMKMLLGLYPTRGAIIWDGEPVGAISRASYRGLFSAIFDGQHLFDRLYGLEVPRARVEAALARFGIDHVVRFDGARFGPLALSSGQQMRLAMVVALLEDRPIVVFDEWTAHQDPSMTWYYYDVLLPELTAAGKTVIAVSHDDRFFERADHFVQLAGGRVSIDHRRARRDQSENRPSS